MYLILRPCKKQAQGSQLIYTLSTVIQRKTDMHKSHWNTVENVGYCCVIIGMYNTCKSNECYIFYKSLKCKYPDADWIQN